ncbi:efflux RND transporter periplasmic adaptor subunit [Tropicibacter naphthalenivorans]|uniref:Macrolide-specific efflux protein MacA n=1 Tax=Tropicibacter naphthalenivorans TaxID=441103 RepID=A0A0N7LYM8_9RHOB|nr:HlyD family efflux transporter periplasmic adaptor subunit [Tropicibacter naphthalenivorans]CUH75305.1 Macrolide-specific efflux protein MacA precursor [Tropicibacter naphthalenivorans]SMC45154.1 HlyD family secretion protein [Tropicibacter naphthalenivorans]
MTLTLRTLGLSAAALAIVGGLAFTAMRTDPVPVDLGQVTRGALSVTVNADGKTRIRDLYEVSAPIAGTVLRLPVHVGDRVNAGDVVAQVEPATPTLLDARSRAQAEAALHEAEASVQYARAEVTRTEAAQAYAQTQFTRTQALVDRGAASLTALEDASQRLTLAQAGAQSAVAQLEMSLAAVESARAVLVTPEQVSGATACCMALTAPVDGVVVDITDENARPVVAGAQLLSIGDPSDLEIVVDLLSSEATRLKPGARASVERWGGDPLEAELTLIEPAARTVVSALGIEEQRVDAILDLTSSPEAWKGLGQGFAAFVRIEEWRSDDTLLIPLSAIFRRDGAWFTYAVEDGVAQEVSIQIGRRDGQMAQLLQGLGEGAQIVLHPPDTVADGVAVAPRLRQ